MACVAWTGYEQHELTPAPLHSSRQVQYTSNTAASSGLKDHLLATAPKKIVCVDIDPWLGMQASGGISSGQNGMGRALMAVRDELLQ